MQKSVKKKQLVQYGDARLPKSCILHLAADFQKIRTEGRYLSGRLLTIGFYSSEGVGFKAGFITSKRVHKRAVYRNRSKRKLREALRLTRVKIDKDVWMVLIAKPTILKADAAEVQKELIYLVRKAKIWSE